MGLKSFLIKKTLQMKGVSKEQAEVIANEVAENPEMMRALKALEENKELKALLEKVQKEIEEEKKKGMADAYAAVTVLGRHKAELAKYQDELGPLMHLIGR
jgi:hypothetical protein